VHWCLFTMNNWWFVVLVADFNNLTYCLRRYLLSFIRNTPFNRISLSIIQKATFIASCNFAIAFPRCLVISAWKSLKGQVQCFLMQFVMKKCFLLTLKKNWQICLVVLEKNYKTMHFNSEKMTLPNRKLGYS